MPSLGVKLEAAGDLDLSGGASPARGRRENRRLQRSTATTTTNAPSPALHDQHVENDEDNNVDNDDDDPVISNTDTTADDAKEVMKNHDTNDGADADDDDDDDDDDDGDGNSDSDDSCSSRDTDGSAVVSDTSELDFDECVLRRSACVRQLQRLERQFAVLKQQLLAEKLALIDARLAGVRDGTAAEYLQPLDRLSATYRQRGETAAALRAFRLANSHHRHCSELMATEQQVVADREHLEHHLREEIEQRLRRLEEDRRHVDSVAVDLWSDAAGGRSSLASYWGAGGDDEGSGVEEASGRKRRRTTVSGPYIVYMLAESDIVEDWTTIRKAVSVTKRKGDFKIMKEVNVICGL